MCTDEGLGGSGDEEVTPFMTHTIKLPMRQEISGFWDSLPRRVSFSSTHSSVFSLQSFSLVSSIVFPEVEVSACSTWQHITLCLSIRLHCGLMSQTLETHSSDQSQYRLRAADQLWASSMRVELM